MQSATNEQVEKLLRQLQGVEAASVSGTFPDVDMIHILATTRRSSTQVLRDARSAIIAQFGENLPPNRLRVLTLSGESMQDVRPTRPVLLSVEVARVDGVYEAKVVLAYKDRVTEGKATTDVDCTGVKLVAEATLQAVHLALRQNPLFYLEHIDDGRIAGRPFVLVAIELRTDRLNRPLLGTAYVLGSLHQATAVAVLDAVNRQFERPTD